MCPDSRLGLVLAFTSRMTFTGRTAASIPTAASVRVSLNVHVGEILADTLEVGTGTGHETSIHTPILGASGASPKALETFLAYRSHL